VSSLLYRALCDYLVSCYPHEGCGVILGPRHPLQGDEMIPCRNIHAQSTTHYHMDPQDLMAIEKKCRLENKEIKIIFHSHVNAEAYFSPTDQQEALWEGKPLYPNAKYLVVSIVNGKIADTKCFQWQEGDFKPQPLADLLL
jgi:proteasome lid subunit RPN8/RPN11